MEGRIIKTRKAIESIHLKAHDPAERGLFRVLVKFLTLQAREFRICGSSRRPTGVLADPWPPENRRNSLRRKVPPVGLEPTTL